MSFHRYIQHSGAPDFATAMSVGGGGGEYISSADSEPLLIGSELSAPSEYLTAESFLSFDTSAVLATPAVVTLTLGRSFGSFDSSSDAIVAIYDWGATIATGDWRTSAQLAALTEVGRFATAGLPSSGATFDIDIDPTGIVLGGITRFVLFTENMATPTTDPTLTEDFFVEGDGGTNPPVLLVDDAPPPPPPAVARGLQVRTVTMDGTEIDVLPLASVGDVERTLNQPDAATWSFPKGAYTAAQIPVIGTDAQPVEVQIWTAIDGVRDVLLFWGPTVDIQGSGADGAMHCTGAGVDWYLIRRYLDGQRTNLLSNPSFEIGTLDDWIDGGAVTSTVTTDGKVLGTKAARLVSSTPGGDIHIHQAVDVTATGVGTLLTVAAWYQVETFTAAAFGKRGLYVEGLQASVVKATATVQIDENTPTDLWLRAETTIWIPPDLTWEIDVRCYSPDGSILWDAVELVAMESVSTAGLVGTVAGEADITRIVRQHVLHLQDAAVGKSDVNITTDPDRALIGVTMAKHIQFADHISYDSQIREFQERADGIDTAILYDPDAGTRELFVFYPRRGVDRSGNCSLEFPGNVADYTWHRDGTATVTTATWLGDGDGPDREEGYFSDASFIGGVTLEDVKQAPTGSAISSLEPLAEGEVTLLNNPPRVIDVNIRPDATFVGGAFDGVPLLNGLDPGDWVPLTIDDGYVQETGSSWRIVKLVFNGDTRVLTATLNEDLG